MFTIISKAKWGGKAARTSSSDPILKVGAATRKGFVVHYTWTGAGSNAAGVPAILRSVQQGHFNLGRNDIGYNYLIDKWGNIYMGRGWNYRAAGVGARISVKNPKKGLAAGNTPNISVSYVGKNDSTAAAKQGILDIYAYVCGKVGKRLPVFGHRDYNATACPGDPLYKWLNSGVFAQRAVWTNTSKSRATDKVNVRAIQTIANHAISVKLISGSPVSVNGTWTDALTTLVKRLQGHFGLTQDAVVGEQSWPRFESVLGIALPKPPVEPDPEPEPEPEVPEEPETPVDPEEPGDEDGDTPPVGDSPWWQKLLDALVRLINRWLDKL